MRLRTFLSPLAMAIQAIAIFAATATPFLSAQLINPTQIGWYNGAGAPSLSCSVSRNGTIYVDTTGNALYACNGIADAWHYIGPSTFTIESDTTPLPQEPALNFSSRFSVQDVSGQRTNVDLGPSGVTAGTYNCANVTVDAYGFVTSITPGSCTAPYYQTIQSNTTAKPQETALNFSSRFSVQDVSGQRTNVDLGLSGVTAGTYDCANVTVDAYGFVTSIGAGSCGGATSTARLLGTCTTGGNTYDTCDNTMTWSSAFADTTYSAVCFGIGPSDPRAVVHAGNSKTTGTIVAQTVTEGSVAVTFSEIDCIGVEP